MCMYKLDLVFLKRVFRKVFVAALGFADLCSSSGSHISLGWRLLVLLLYAIFHSPGCSILAGLFRYLDLSLYPIVPTYIIITETDLFRVVTYRYMVHTKARA